MNVTDTVVELITNVTQGGTNESSAKEYNSVELGLYVTLEVCIAIFAFSSNVLVIVALCKFHSLRSPTNRFVASLAVADIAVAIFAIPSAVLLRFGLSVKHDGCDDVIYGPSVREKMCLIIVSSVVFLTQVSIFCLLLIAIDRFVAINYPFKYSSFMTTTKTRIAIIAAWILAGLISIAPEVGWNKWSGVESPCEKTECAFEQVVSMEYMVYFNFFACVLIPLIAMGVMYFFIFRSAKKQLEKIYYDVKDLKRKYYFSRPSEVADQTKHSTTTTLVEQTSGVYDNRKKRAKNLNGSSLSTLHDECFSEDSPTKETPGDNFVIRGRSSNNSSGLELNIDRRSPRKAGNGDSNFILPEETNNGTKCTHSNCSLTLCGANGEGDRNSHYEMVCILETVTQDGSNESDANLQSENINEKRSLPREKIEEKEFHPPDVHSAFDQSKIPTCKTTTTPLERASNGEATSYNSSRLTRNAVEREKWSTTDNNGASDQEFQRKMKRKRQLLKKEFHAARSLATVVGLFAFCWLPLHILNCVTLFCPGCYQPPWLKDLAILLSHANSVLNPLIYAYKLRDFRNAFRKLLAPFCPTLGDKFCCFVTPRSLDMHESTSEDRSNSGEKRHEKNPGSASTLHVSGVKRRNNENNNSSACGINGVTRLDPKHRHTVRKITQNVAEYIALSGEAHLGDVSSDYCDVLEHRGARNHSKSQPLLKVISPLKVDLFNSRETNV